MSLPGYVPGMPRIGTVRSTTPRIIFRDGLVEWLLSGGKVISGATCRDIGNTGNLDVLRAGVLMGKISSVVNSLGTVDNYAVSVMGRLSAAYAAAATTMTMTAPSAVELNRRAGASGTFKIAGPPTAAGVMAIETVTYSAINVTTGVATITALANSYVSGALVLPTDGSEQPLTLIPDTYGGTGLKMTDIDDSSNLDIPFSYFPVGGTLIGANIIAGGTYPADATIRTWIRTALSTAAGGKFAFDDVY